MTCLFDCEIDIDWDFDYMKLYEDCVEAVLDEEKCPYETSVSLLVTDDREMEEINYENRNINSSTDVLSFPMTELPAPSDFSDAEEHPDYFDPESGELMLGDIVISADHVKAQAEEYGHDIQREYAFLIVHSMLHLCGYDHMEEDDRILMEERQKVIMERMCHDHPKLAVRR